MFELFEMEFLEISGISFSWPGDKLFISNIYLDLLKMSVGWVWPYILTILFVNEVQNWMWKDIYLQRNCIHHQNDQPVAFLYQPICLFVSAASFIVALMQLYQEQQINLSQKVHVTPFAIIYHDAMANKKAKPTLKCWAGGSGPSISCCPCGALSSCQQSASFRLHNYTSNSTQEPHLQKCLSLKVLEQFRSSQQVFTSQV